MIELDRRQLLDHGYIELVEHWGSDERIVEAARMSTDKGFRGWGGAPCPECRAAGRLSEYDGLLKDDLAAIHARQNCKTCSGRPGRAIGEQYKDEPGYEPGDEKLLRYLYEHKHATPFEMAGLIVEVQAPIFVFREWHRHRTQSYNEMSARYMPLPDVNYMPTVERLMLNAGASNRQAGTVKGSSELTAEAAEQFRSALGVGYDALQTGYEAALADGVPKELARLILPVARYSKMRASANLRNWLAFLTLREAPQAMWEIRQYAHALSDFVKQLFPRTHALYAEHGGL